LNLGKQVRLNRLFAHPSGRLCSVAVDHFMGYQRDLPAGLHRMRSTLAAVMAARPDAVTMHKGNATGFWGPYAGQVPLIIQASFIRPDDSIFEFVATPEDALRLGADAFAVAAFVRGDTEAKHLRVVADFVRQSARLEIPLICHIYPRHMGPTPRISYEPEDIAWAVHCASEIGADVVKVPYCGDVAAHAQIVAECPVPVVAAGGPKTDTQEAALAMMAEVVRSGARGATIGRNIWGFDHITESVHAFKAVIHDGLSAQEAMRRAGL
jgi:class I fructose-bisphosphate aldolase